MLMQLSPEEVSIIVTVSKCNTENRGPIVLLLAQNSLRADHYED